VVHEQAAQEPQDDIDRRAAQESANELARMGISPGMLGLEPVVSTASAAARVRGVAAVAGSLASPPANLPARSAPVFPAGTAKVASTPRPGPAPVSQQSTVFAPPPMRSRTTAGGNGATESRELSPRPGDGEASPYQPPAGGLYQGRPVAPEHTGSVLNRPLTGELVLPPSMVRNHPTSKPARTRPDRTGLPAGLRRGVRAVVAGLANPGVAAAAERDRQLVARIRARQREPRLVAIVGGAPRSGTTTTTIAAAQVLDAIRRDTTVVIDARYGAASIGRRLTGAPPITDHNGLALTREPLQLGGSPGDATWYAKPVDQQFTDLLDRLRGQFAFTLVDVGAEFLATGEAALRRADQIMVVVPANQSAVGHAKAGLGRVYSADPSRIATVVLAVVGIDASDQKGTARQVSNELGLPLDRIVPVPFDPALAGRGFDPTRLRAATCEAYLRLGACLAQPDPVGQW
jgi:hypothetical protein